jgi:putative serine protease PepD
MSENDMNEQPMPPADDHAGWRPTYEQPAAAAQPPAPEGVPTSQAPAAQPPAAQPPAGYGPAYNPAAQPPAGYGPAYNPAAPGSAAPAPASGAPAPGAPAYPAQPAAPAYPPYAPSPYVPQTGYAPGSAYPMGTGETPTSSYPTAGTATSSYPVTGAPEPRRTRGIGFATIALFSALGLVLAGGGGIAGAAIMHHFDKNDSTVTVTSSGRVVSNAPIIDRSSLASIAAGVSPSVVSITTQNATGSGVILSKDGYILTNNHVAATATGSTVEITFNDGSSAKATLVGTDPKTDLAVFKAEGVSDLHAATFGDSSALQVGDTVLAIGSPLGLDGTVTAGIVSALNRTINESADSSPQNPSDPFGQSQQSQTQGPTIAGAIQTDASINPGNSGGALVNTNGQVVGINTAIATNGGAEGSIGVGFSIPSNRAQAVANDIIKGTKVSHPQLGIDVATADSNAGALVTQVVSGSAADKGGLQANDVITKFDGTVVHTQDDLLNDIQSAQVGKPYQLTVNRGGSTVTLTVVLQEAK